MRTTALLESIQKQHTKIAGSTACAGSIRAKQHMLQNMQVCTALPAAALCC
jgi:hypothetical protein